MQTVGTPRRPLRLSSRSLLSALRFPNRRLPIGEEAPSQLKGLLRTVIENGRLCALPEIAAQFRALKNESEGVADAYIESAYALTKKDVDQLVKALSQKFPGVTLRPEVSINKDLIGGVSIRVGDQVLDGSVRARLAQMKAALTA